MQEGALGHILPLGDRVGSVGEARGSRTRGWRGAHCVTSPTCLCLHFASPPTPAWRPSFADRPPLLPSLPGAGAVLEHHPRLQIGPPAGGSTRPLTAPLCRPPLGWPSRRPEARSVSRGQVKGLHGRRVLSGGNGCGGWDSGDQRRRREKECGPTSGKLDHPADSRFAAAPPPLPPGLRGQYRAAAESQHVRWAALVMSARRGRGRATRRSRGPSVWGLRKGERGPFSEVGGATTTTSGGRATPKGWTSGAVAAQNMEGEGWPSLQGRGNRQRART